jgi:DNA polymerase-3 subunit gamma/tau
MSYQVLARKWRPKQFSEVVSQPHVTRTLENAITQNRLASAYLFTGPRGVGKTTMARILAKAINCEAGMSPAPCDECSNCRETAEGRSLDVFEIDGASNRGIDEVRNLRENARYQPSKSRYKIYIIDEVHMLTEPAFNALLKTLEEPPAHVLFVFATTEIHKVPATILSRCQRFDFHRVPVTEMVEQLRHICSHENISIDDQTLFLIAKKADGSMRDSQSLLDQVISFCGQKIVHTEVAMLLGIVDQELFFECTDAVSAHDAVKGLALVEKIYNAGYDAGEFLEQLAEHFSNILTTTVTNDTAHLIGLEVYAARYLQASRLFSEIDALRHIKIITETVERLRRSANARLLLETALLKMIRLAPAVEMEKVIEAVNSGSASNTPKPASGQTQSNRPSSTQTTVAAAQSSEPAIASTSTSSVTNSTGSVTTIEPPKKKHEPAASRPAPGYSIIPQYGQAKSNGGLFGGMMPGKQTPAAAKATAVPVVRAQAAPEIVLQDIQSNWQTVVEHVSSKRISLGSFLSAGAPREVVDGALEISFAQENGFHIDSINNQRHLIQECIQDATGHTVRIVCRRDENGALSNGATHANGNGSAGSPTGAASAAVRPAQKSLEEYYQEIPELRDVVEALDGELIRR